MDVSNEGFLFEHLPREINLQILNSIGADDLLRLSCTCKRWLNNTRNVTDLDFILTRKPTRVLLPKYNTKFLKTRPAQLHTTNISIALSRFTPEHLHSLRLSPNLTQPCDVVDNFITKCTSLRTLHCKNWDSFISAFSTLTQLKHMNVGLMSRPKSGDKFAMLMKKLPNLETLEFNVPCVEWKEITIKEFYSDLQHLKKFTINSDTRFFMKYEYLGQMAQLTQLKLVEAFITDDEFKYLAGLTNLEILSLNRLQTYVPKEYTDDEESVSKRVIGNPDPTNGLRHLTTLNKLTHLDVSHWESAYASEIQSSAIDIVELVQRHWTNLTTIDISECNLGKECEIGLDAISNSTGRKLTVLKIPKKKIMTARISVGSFDYDD